MAIELNSQQSFKSTNCLLFKWALDSVWKCERQSKGSQIPRITVEFQWILDDSNERRKGGYTNRHKRRKKDRKWPVQSRWCGSFTCKTLLTSHVLFLYPTIFLYFFLAAFRITTRYRVLKCPPFTLFGIRYFSLHGRVFFILVLLVYHPFSTPMSCKTFHENDSFKRTQ